MKRISIGHVASVLSFFLAVASVGCIGQTSSTGDGTTAESTLDSSQNTPNGVDGDPQSGAFEGKNAQALELKVHPAGESGGPSPEPCETQQGPSPEPWNGHAIMVSTDPKGGTKP
jgi:hypothetical protein